MPEAFSLFTHPKFLLPAFDKKITMNTAVPVRSSSFRKPSISAITPLNLLRTPSSSLSNDSRARAVNGLYSPPSAKSPHDHYYASSPSSESEMGTSEAPLGNRRPVSQFSTIAHHLSMSRPTHDSSEPMTPEQEKARRADTHIQQGIHLHEQLLLTESTHEFELAAELGSATGMYLFGMALRSGWGVPVDEDRSFGYLSRAADLALKHASVNKSDRDTSARELTLAVYELGQSFRNGWGVKKDRRVGAHYLQIAANLGDPDAQVDVATAYVNGDGVKRDKMAAAKYFRLAANGGFKAPNMAWIWKDKYDATGVPNAQKVAY